MCKTEETIRMRILAYLSAYVTTLTNSKSFKNGIMGLYTTQAKYLRNELRINLLSPSQNTKGPHGLYIHQIMVFYSGNEDM